MALPKQIEIIAHRGASGIAPENTLAAFSKAMAFGVDFIEMDIHLTHDEIPVIIHDASLKRTVGIKKKISQLTHEAVKKFDAGKWFDTAFTGEHIPTLEMVLQKVGSTTGLMLEIKHSPKPVAVVVKSIFDVLEQFSGSLPPIIMGSFSLALIEELNKQKLKFPHPIKTIGIVEKHNMISPMLAHGVELMAVWHKILTPGLVKNILAHGLDTWSFTVDDIILAEFLISIGVKGVISNFPQRLLSLK